MNPPQEDLAQEHPERFGQFLVQLDDGRLLQHLFQADRVAGIEGPGGRAERKSPQDSESPCRDVLGRADPSDL